jgi:hypothetical protein
MSNPNPVQTDEFKKHQFKKKESLDLGDKVFGIRLPVAIEEKLLAMPSRERVNLMRKCLIDGVEKNQYG